MTHAVRRFLSRRREVSTWSEEEEARLQLTESLDRTRILIHQAYASFNNADDSDLIESYVYEINALQSRYSYLLRRLKELGVAEAVSAETDVLASCGTAQPQ